MRLIASFFANCAILVIIGIGGALALVDIYGRELPSRQALVEYQPPVVSRVYSGEGDMIAEFAEERRVYAAIDEVPDLVKHAFISAEDKNFYTHPGVDMAGVVKALGRYAIARAQGRPVRLAGASTITQQVMKNFLVGDARSVERKVKEMILAVRLDGALSKDRILELYLNEIFFGARAYGVAAAAQTYFGKGLEDLTPGEAAYLAALPKAPSNLHPVRDYDYAVDRRNYVLGQMAENGYLGRDEAEAAMAEPLVTLIDKEWDDPFRVPEGDYFTAEIRRQLVESMGSSELYGGGLTIRATVEPRLQEIAGRVLRNRLEEWDRGVGIYRGPAARIEGFDAERWAVQLDAAGVPRDIPGWLPAVVLSAGEREVRIGIDLGAPGDAVEATLDMGREDWIGRVATGETRGGEPMTAPRPGAASEMMAPGDVVFVSRAAEDAPWRLRQIPELEGALMAMDPHSGRVLALQGGFSFQHSVFNRATQAERQPGSSFKPFVYAAALDAGFTPDTTVLDAPVVVRLTSGTWKPKNSSGNFYGPQPLSTGLILSRNLMTVRIAQQIGMQRIANYAERFGVYQDMPHHLSYALGAGETTLWDMVAAYGMFANGGKRVRPSVIDRIQDRRGDTVYRHDPLDCEGCFGPSVTPAGAPTLYDTRAQIMNPVTAHQLVEMMEGVVTRGTAARTVGDLGFPVAGKTGTTNDNIDAWFIGFSPNLVAGCFIGHDQPRTIGRRAYGGTMCGPVFRDFMTAAMEGREAGRFPGPDWGETTYVEIKVDRYTGQRLPDDAEGPDVVTQQVPADTLPAIERALLASEGEEPDPYAPGGVFAVDPDAFALGETGGGDDFALDGDGGDGGDGPVTEAAPPVQIVEDTALPVELGADLPRPDETVADAGALDEDPGGAPPPPDAGGIGLGTGGLY